MGVPRLSAERIHTQIARLARSVPPDGACQCCETPESAEHEPWCHARLAHEGVDALEAELVVERERAERLHFLAERMFQMIPPEVWREQGGDDGQGHYEGDYWAEQLRDELVALSAASTQEPHDSFVAGQGANFDAPYEGQEDE